MVVLVGNGCCREPQRKYWRGHKSWQWPDKHVEELIRYQWQTGRKAATQV
jgi:hypothetical protein